MRRKMRMPAEVARRSHAILVWCSCFGSVSMCAPLLLALQSLLRARPTVSPDEMKSYEKFTAEFGEEG